MQGQHVLTMTRTRLHDDQHVCLDLGRKIAECRADSAAAVAADM